jgi:hypothetical protein
MSGVPMLNTSSPTTFHDVLRREKDIICQSLPGNDRWNRKLRAFLEDWSNNQNDNKLWKKTEDEAERRGRSPEVFFFVIVYSAAEALFESEDAQRFKPKELRERAEYYQRLAESAQSLINHYRKFGVGINVGATLQFSSEPELLHRLKEEVSWFRLQSHKHSRRQSPREQTVFMRALATRMRRSFDNKPYYEVVAAIARIAMRDDSIEAWNAREACRNLPPVRRVSIRPAEIKVLVKALRQPSGKLGRK